MNEGWYPNAHQTGACGIGLAHNDEDHDMCRDCGESHLAGGPCPADCAHARRTEGRDYETATCLDCGRFVALIGEEDEEGRPTWEIL